MNRFYKTLVHGLIWLGAGSSALWSQSIDGQPVVASGGKAIFEFSDRMGLTRDVHWSVVQPEGGVMSANGMYRAPLKSGKYRVEGFSRADPTRVAHWDVEVKEPSKITQAWEIHGDVSKYGVSWQCVHRVQYLYDWEDYKNNNKPYQEGEVELGFKSGKMMRFPCVFLTNDQAFGVNTSLYCVAENQDLSEVNRIRLMRKDGTSPVLLDEAVNGELADQEWTMVELEEGKFKVRPTKDWEDDYRKGVKVYVSWDRGLTWQEPRQSNVTRNWMHFQIPLGGLLDDPDPLVQFEITKGFNRKAKTYSLKDILKRSNQRTPNGAK